MTTSARIHWSDIKPGDTFDTDSITISRKDILEFAADFDPQPYHLEEEAARNSIFGGLCASGWHVTALMMRLLTDTFNARDIDLLGSDGVSKLRWRKPVFAEDSLVSTITVQQKSPPASDPRIGYIDCHVEVDNQHGDQVIVLSTTLLIGTGEVADHG